MRHAERARLSHKPAVRSTPYRAWGHYRAQAPSPLSPAAVAPSVAATWGHQTLGGDAGDLLDVSSIWAKAQLGSYQRWCE
jgi:hypothetical protein